MLSKPSDTPLRVVLDTNILVSAAINKFGASSRLFDRFQKQELVLVTSEFQLRELTRVLHYKRIKKKYRLTETAIKKIVGVIRRLSVIVTAETIPEAAADQDDNQILAAAIEGKTDTIVSGDEHLLELKNYRRIKIMTAKQFLQSRKLLK